jgi:hypothetical protein
LDGLVNQLQALDNQRRNVAEQIRLAMDGFLSGGEGAFPWGKQPSRTAAATAGTAKTTGRRKRRKMSKEARAKISAAQKARWAKQKKSDK